MKIRYLITFILTLSFLSFNAIAQSEGEQLFIEKCGMCHRDLGMGTLLLMNRIPREQAKLEDRSELPAELVKAVVRNGLGNMFSISRAEVSDEQLEKIASYLSGE
jgi:mono/diheme cytochrome c family protein